MPRPALGPELLVVSSFNDTAVRRAHRGGDLVRLAPGRYVRAGLWALLDAPDREILRIVAIVSRMRTPVVVSHASAAALWRLPSVGEARSRVDVVDPALSEATAGRLVLRHAARLGPAETVELHGVRVTSPARTAVDLALSATFRQSVVGLDHALRCGLLTRDDLESSLGEHPAVSRRLRARRAIGFADARADSPGESLSRVVIAEDGLVAPELQHHFRGPRGQRAHVDFWWSGAGVVGEFDGEVKYRDRALRGDRSPEQVVIDEKERENWIRALPEVRAVVRWTWRDALTPGRVTRALRAAGVPLRGRSTF